MSSIWRMVLISLVFIPEAAWGEAARFSREILPILSDRCFHCHGPDEGDRKADLRLDDEGSVRELIASGELKHRLTTSDLDEQMPPPDSHREPLDKDELALVQRWISEGAPWGKHWAFEKAVRPTVPEGDHPIDAFVMERLRKVGQSLSPMAESHTLRRRVSFDLTGLPPASVATESSWDDVVEELLESPHHGERLAMWWRL